MYICYITLYYITLYYMLYVYIIKCYIIYVLNIKKQRKIRRKKKKSCMYFCNPKSTVSHTNANFLIHFLLRYCIVTKSKLDLQASLKYNFVYNCLESQ